jgi:hypothetical protein
MASPNVLDAILLEMWKLTLKFDNHVLNSAFTSLHVKNMIVKRTQ